MGIYTKGLIMEKSQKSSMSVTMGPVQLLMIAAIVVGAYYVGTLKAKVDYLQNGGAPTTGTAPAAAAPAAAAPPQTADNVPKITKDDWVKGDRNAPVALIEYSDHECPFCKQFHPTAQKVVDEYKGKVQWVYRTYPLSFHANAQKEAEASLCAGDQGGNEAFWKFTDAVYSRTTSNGTGFALDALVPLAKEIGLNESTFKTCLDSGKMAAKVTEQMDGGTKAGVSGTPGNIVMNVKTGETRLIPGAVPYEQIKPVIDEMLAK